MNHKEKIQWMAVWCAKNGLKLDLNGQVGFGRECVGVSDFGTYADYEWFDKNCKRIDGNKDVWTPPNAYHKHPCVAVLGRGKCAESQLYDWLKWFDDNKFHVERGDTPEEEIDKNVPLALTIMFGKHRFLRMARKTTATKRKA